MTDTNNPLITLDELMADALEHLPPPAAKAKGPTGPALPARTQHHSPIEAESRFVRFAAWWEETECLKCQHVERKFEGLYEEREWIAEHLGGPQHWLFCSVAPVAGLTKDAVSYVRYYTQNLCEKCTGAERWPLAQKLRGEEIVSYGGHWRNSLKKEGT